MEKIYGVIQKIESVWEKCQYDHWLTNKAYLSAVTVTNISQSFYLQDCGKNQLAYIWNKIKSPSPYDDIIAECSLRQSKRSPATPSLVGTPAIRTHCCYINDS